MYVVRSLCTLKSLNKVKATFWGAKLSIDGDEFKPQSDWYQPWDMMSDDIQCVNLSTCLWTEQRQSIPIDDWSLEKTRDQDVRGSA